jgi:hypothetical protein
MDNIKKIKLSKVQHEVIKLMRYGHQLSESGFYFKNIQSSTIKSLMKKKIIQKDKDHFFIYLLTELGKTIQL